MFFAVKHYQNHPLVRLLNQVPVSFIFVLSTNLKDRSFEVLEIVVESGTKVSPYYLEQRYLAFLLRY